MKMPSLWKKLAVAAMVCGVFSFMPGSTEAAIAPQADYLSLTIPGQIQVTDLSVAIDGIAMEEKLSPAERRRIQRERWERERRRREMERRRYHRPPPPPPRRHHYPPPRRRWSADLGQTGITSQFSDTSTIVME